MEQRVSPIDSPSAARLDAVVNSLAELRNAVARQQQDMSAMNFRLTAAERSPPRPMEVEQQLDFFAQIQNGSYRAQGSNESPRTRVDWNNLCTQLMQKRSWSRDDFIASVLGLAASVTNQWDHYGDMYHIYKLSLHATPSEYRTMINRFIEASQDIDFFREVSIGPDSGFRYQVSGPRYWRGAYARESTPEAPKTQARSASSSQTTAEPRRGIKPEK
ncbi:hypothetical protein Emag_007878 [Eimeria magna]